MTRILSTSDTQAPSAMNRLQFLQVLVGAGVAARLPTQMSGANASFRLDYIVSTCMYGQLPLETILPEIRRTGVRSIDVWPRPHGSQREEIDTLGFDRFQGLLKENGLRVGCLTRYDLGPFGLSDEMRLSQRLGCPLVITGGHGPKNLKGEALRSAVKTFAEQLREPVAAAGEHGVTIAIENHGNNLIDSPDSLKWLLEFLPSPQLGIALAPYHLENLALTAADIAQLIRDMGSRIKMFYAWQYGMGCMTKLPKEQELLQLPGRGSLDFKPLLRSLQGAHYAGFTQVFMHPVPRGIPILPTAQAVTEEIKRSQNILDRLLD